MCLLVIGYFWFFIDNHASTRSTVGAQVNGGYLTESADTYKYLIVEMFE